MIESAVKIIETVEEFHLKADLLAVVSILAGEKFSSELVKKYIRKEMLMMSPLFDEWVKEDRKEAVIANTKQRIIEILEERFDVISKETRERLEKIGDKEALDVLFRKAIRVSTLVEFEQLVNKVLH